MRVLITGGAGFIGRHLARRLARAGRSVVILDSLLPQILGEGVEPPTFSGDVQLVRGDVRDRQLLDAIFGDGIDAIYHLASLTGVGQSMYEIDRYVDVNCRGTAVLWEAIASAEKRPRKLVLSSSRAVYGEGRLACPRCGAEFFPSRRDPARLAANNWEHACPRCGADAEPRPTGEGSPALPTSVYAMTKLGQEQLCAVAGQAYGVPVAVLRYFNVYGPEQSPTNPYTGILSIFCRRLVNGQGLEIYEDGRELRDFVNVADVARATMLAGESDAVGTFNVCSGEETSVYAVAEALARTMGRDANTLAITGRYRVGDIRHSVGSFTAAQNALGYSPQVTMEAGLQELAEWFRGQTFDRAADPDGMAKRELEERGLYV